MKNQQRIAPKLVRPLKSSQDAQMRSPRHSSLANPAYELSMEKNFKFMSSYANPIVKNASSLSNYNMQQRKMSQVAGSKSIFNK